ncbi:MAG: AraC family transcriptional regulator ligand-binding domain-containing protein [Cyanobacteria bacterium P01_H01_bin.105]
MMPVEPAQILSSRSQTTTAAVAHVFNYAVHQGISELQLSAETGLLRTDLINPENRLPADLISSILQVLGSAYPEQAIGLQMASIAPLSVIGPLPQIMKYAENLRSVLQAFVRYRFVLSEQLWADLIESNDEALLRMHHPLDALDGGRGAESAIALIRRLIQQAIGQEDSLVRVEFVHRPYSLSRAYETFFGVPVCFQQPYNTLVFRREALNLPTKQGDVYLFRYIQGNLDLLRDRWGLSNHTSPLAEIHHTITHKAEFYQYSAEGIARDMNMNLRSLQRLVCAHGFTVRQLLENARKEKARQWLSDPTLNIKAVATRLGYSDDRAFRRAFKRWTGQTPAEFRQQSR